MTEREIKKLIKKYCCSCTQNLPQYTDDAAAAAGGIPVGGHYVDDNGFVKQRLV